MSLSKKKEITPPLHVFYCFHCHQSITSDNTYFEIAKYSIPHNPAKSRKQFHADCFEEIAGSVYSNDC